MNDQIQRGNDFMKKQIKVLSTIAAAAVCTLILAACVNSASSKSSSSSTSSSELSSSTSSSSSESSSQDISSSSEEVQEPSEDVIGKVTQTDGKVIEISVYTIDTPIEDYASLNAEMFTDSGEIGQIEVDDKTEYFVASSGELAAAEAGDVTEGDIIAETTTAEGNQQIIILKDAADQPDTAGEEDSEKAIDVKIAEVTAITDNKISLTLYSPADDTAENQITDPASIEMSNYTASTTTEELTISANAVVKECKDGAATDMEASKIAVGDMLAIYTDADGVETIMVYHSEA